MYEGLLHTSMSAISKLLQTEDADVRNYRGKTGVDTGSDNGCNIGQSGQEASPWRCRAVSVRGAGP